MHERPALLDSAGRQVSARYPDDNWVLQTAADCQYAHPVDGVLFMRHAQSVKGSVVIEYSPITDPDELREIQTSITTGVKTRAFALALVRRRTKGTWSYYPLPLLMAGEGERAAASMRASKPLAPTTWVNEQRELVRDYLTTHLQQ